MRSIDRNVELKMLPPKKKNKVTAAWAAELVGRARIIADIAFDICIQSGDDATCKQTLCPSRAYPLRPLTGDPLASKHDNRHGRGGRRKLCSKPQDAGLRYVPSDYRLPAQAAVMQHPMPDAPHNT